MCSMWNLLLVFHIASRYHFILLDPITDCTRSTPCAVVRTWRRGSTCKTQNKSARKRVQKLVFAMFPMADNETNFWMYLNFLLVAHTDWTHMPQYLLTSSVSVCLFVGRLAVRYHREWTKKVRCKILWASNNCLSLTKTHLELSFKSVFVIIPRKRITRFECTRNLKFLSTYGFCFIHENSWGQMFVPKSPPVTCSRSSETACQCARTH